MRVFNEIDTDFFSSVSVTQLRRVESKHISTRTAEMLQCLRSSLLVAAASFVNAWAVGLSISGYDIWQKFGSCAVKLGSLGCE